MELGNILVYEFTEKERLILTNRPGVMVISDDFVLPTKEGKEFTECFEIIKTIEPTGFVMKYTKKKEGFHFESKSREKGEAVSGEEMYAWTMIRKYVKDNKRLIKRYK